ncbi:MAG: SDR family NAD(P)-dependent oxidoreductase, partial [Myxococcaceae bacterium]
VEHIYRAALESGLAQPAAIKLAHAVRARVLETLPPLTEDTFGACTGLTAAVRVAARFGFGGGALSVDAACASSLAAVHVAGFALAQRELDVVIAGGVAANLIPEYYAVLMALGFLSSRGSFPFDDRAEGFVPSEGGAAVVLKRLEDAEAAKDRILAVITGIGASSDGKATTLFAPDTLGRRRSVERALENARTEPDWIDIIEGHGSGTRRSDETEVLAYADALYSRTTDNAVSLGAIKSQIGHLSSAGAAASLVKMAHALANKTLPPMNGGEYPNPEIPFQRLPVSLALEARPWRTLLGRLRRAGVCGFGLGGSNYHVILEEAPVPAPPRKELEELGNKPHPQPPRGLFADRWKVGLAPLSLQTTTRFALEGKRVLLLAQGDDVAGAISSTLEQAGATVERLRLTWMVDPLEVEQRVRAVAGAGTFDGVVDACELARAPDFLARGTTQFAQDMAASSARWYGTARALYPRFARAAPRSTFWLALTAMGGDFGFYGDGGNVLGGGIAGFLKGLKQELPQTLFKVIDFEASVPAVQVAQVALSELREGSDRVEAGYLAGRRFVPTLVRSPFQASEEVLFPIDSSWVVVFSGGGRGAVFEVAKAMARLGTRVVLTGRTPMPDANAPHLMLDDAAFEQYRKEELLRARQSHPQLTPVAFERLFDARVRERELFQNLTQSFNSGMPLNYEVCDVSDRAQVEALMERVRRTHGRVDGLVHGAMTESSKSLPDKTPELVSSTLAVKVNGLLNLLEATQGDDLKMVACFGSGAGRFGNKGQSDYCAANDLMAKCAMAYAHRARPGVRCVTLDWTAWESVGAAARSRERVASTGVSFIPPAEGVYWFLNELMLGGDTREVAIFDERLFREWICMGNSAQGP